MKIETGTQKTAGGHCAWFTIGVQTFFLQTVDTKKEAKFFSGMLDKALENLYKDAIRSTGTFLREDLNPSFLETIDKINKNLNRK